ncbi:unnamed protein product [Owenia fusiformis]|uniref:Uncharacterized protein n=1 Tax=Owenia fusiformis TaxID=6347 RepID=A0A8J1TCL6_OWEFU|nr:unnamed protein product [Owenia fusiformis]
MSLLRFVTVEGNKRRKTSSTNEDDVNNEDSPLEASAKAGIIEKKGDLFSCPENESLAHCISEDCAMGKGIAVIFKKKFGGIQELKSQGVKTGGVAVLKRKDRFIYYLITKVRYFNKPTYDSLTKSLHAMKTHCQQNNVKHISMPRIGCGLDGLSWDKVSKILTDLFSGSGITITVYTL